MAWISILSGSKLFDTRPKVYTWTPGTHKWLSHTFTSKYLTFLTNLDLLTTFNYIDLTFTCD